MKRDSRLHGLSSDHHQALVIARGIVERTEPWTADDGVTLHGRFERELEPHFRIEEELLLPALRTAGAAEVAARTLEDHSFLRAMVNAARTGDGQSARRFGERLREHVRFEEREMFPACETLLPGSVLDEVARRATKTT